MATITFTTRCANETVSLPSEEAIERLFDDADEWFAFQHRAPETEMELFFASAYDEEKATVNPYATEIDVNGVPDRDIMAAGGWSSPQMLDYYDMSRRGLNGKAGDGLQDYLGKEDDETGFQRLANTR